LRVLPAEPPGLSSVNFIALPSFVRVEIQSPAASVDGCLEVLGNAASTGGLLGPEATDSWVGGSARIIDVEKEALAVLLEALEALGDRHAILSFSGHSPDEVRVLAIKRFDETVATEARRRIAALEPDRYTRVGAAIRHATPVSTCASTNAESMMRIKLGRIAITSSGGRSSSCRRIGTLARARIVSRASTVTGPAFA
jgi:hypothetical protein